MTKETYSYEKLPFSELFKKYTTEFTELTQFYSTNPFNEDDIKSRSESVKRMESHSRYASILSDFHKQIGIQQNQQLAKLSKNNSLAIVTGQQLGIYGGPLFTIYKTISTIGFNQ